MNSFLSFSESFFSAGLLFPKLPAGADRRKTIVHSGIFALLIFIIGFLSGILFMEIRYHKIFWLCRNSKLSGLELSSGKLASVNGNLKILKSNLSINKGSLELLKTKLKINKGSLELLKTRLEINNSNLELLKSNLKIFRPDLKNIFFIQK